MIDYLLEPVANTPLVLFRLLFGSILAVYQIFNWRQQTKHFSAPRLMIGFELTRFLRPLPKRWLGVVLRAEILACMAFTAGVCMPYTPLFICLVRTYLLLLDSGRYYNHKYLICLLLFLYCVVDAEAVLGVGRWQILLLQLQVALVYLFGGVAKINRDWVMRAMPFAASLGRLIHKLPKLRGIVSYRYTAYLFCWGGLVFDLAMFPLLLNPATRVWVVLPFLAFHAFNQWFYGLGIFPYLNYASLALFVPEASAASAVTPHVEPLLFFFCYISAQLLVPVRRLAHPKKASVHADHHYHFSWTMKLLMTAMHGFELQTFDRRTGEAVGTLRLERYVGTGAYFRATASPRAMVLLLARLEPQLERELGPHIGLRAAQWRIAFNERAPVQVVDPAADLRGQEVYVFANYPWHNLQT